MEHNKIFYENIQLVESNVIMYYVISRDRPNRLSAEPNRTYFLPNRTEHGRTSSAERARLNKFGNKAVLDNRNHLSNVRDLFEVNYLL